MTLLSHIAAAIGAAWTNLVLTFTSLPAPTGSQDDALLPDADREERDLRILMSLWF